MEAKVKAKYDKEYYNNNKAEIIRKKKIYRKKNKKKIAEYGKQYRKDNKEKIKKQRKKHREENKEKIAIYNKGYREKNKEYFIRYRKDNSEYIKKYIKEWNKTEDGKASKQRRKAKRRTRERKLINTLTAQEWADILEAYNYKCAYCDVEFEVENMPHKDHIIPLIKGGHNVKENIVPACKSCNSKKGTKILI